MPELQKYADAVSRRLREERDEDSISQIPAWVKLHRARHAEGRAGFRCERDCRRHLFFVTNKEEKAFATLGIDIEATRMLRRRFAYACVDWSERRPHLGGALPSFFNVALRRKWIVQDLDSRALRVTALGRREMVTRFGLHGVTPLAAS